jgi:hypothetical protein
MVPEVPTVGLHKEKIIIVPKKIRFIIVIKPYQRIIISQLDSIDKISQTKTNLRVTLINHLVSPVLMGIPIQLVCYTLMISCLMSIIKLMEATSATE